MMKLSAKNIRIISLMLFSLFFGAGNLIFPPFLGQNAGPAAPAAMCGFLITAVILPVCGVAAVSEFRGLESLASSVSPRFASFFTAAVFLSIGPGLGIPRAASVPFEMAVAPYLPDGIPAWPLMLLYSAVFFTAAAWLSLSPGKLAERFGKYLTPALLFLIAVLAAGFFLFGRSSVGTVQSAYAVHPAAAGFLEGYNTMDAIAALNFGFVISAAIRRQGVNDPKSVLRETIRCGVIAGLILSAVYCVLAFLGMQTSGLYSIQDNGAWVLRCIVKDVFGEPGAILLAAIFTLACLTTCVGLITSVAQYFSTRIPFLSYRKAAAGTAVLSFFICNLGLSAILSISVPVLSMIYPSAIMLIVFGIFHPVLRRFPHACPAAVLTAGVFSILSFLCEAGMLPSEAGTLLNLLPFSSAGLGWVSAACAALASAAAYDILHHKKNIPC